MNRAPQHSDAELVLKLYDLRRETVMRQARAWFGGFAPKTFADLEAVLAPTHPQNAFYRQVTSYWEMVASFVNRGVLHPDMYADNCGEGLFYFAKLELLLPELRAKHSPTAMKQTERVIQENPSVRERYAMFKERVQGKK